MITDELHYLPIDFDQCTILLGYIQRIEKHVSKDSWSMIWLTNGSGLPVPLTVEQATRRMHLRIQEFRR